MIFLAGTGLLGGGARSSVAGVVADFVTHLGLNIDGLLLLAVCLMMGGIFTLMLLMMAKAEGWLDWLPFLRKKASAEAGAANPGKATAGASPPKPAAPAAGQEE